MSSITDGLSSQDSSSSSTVINSSGNHSPVAVSESFLAPERNKIQLSMDNIISNNDSISNEFLESSRDSFTKSSDFANDGIFKENIRPLSATTFEAIKETPPVKIISDFIENSDHVTVTGHQGAVSPLELAKKLFSVDAFPIEQIAKILSRNDAYHLETCREYMNNFKFEGISLDQALRILMEKIPLVGETSSIERLLRCFSNRYWACNQEVEGLNADSWQILTCSLMILNNDLYSTVKSKKMTEKEYVSNTIECFDENTPKPSIILLKNLYKGIKSCKLPAFKMKSKTIQKTKQSSYSDNDDPNSNFEIIKTSPLYYNLSSKPKTFVHAWAYRNSWSLAHVTLMGLKLIIHPKKDDLHTAALVFNLAHSFTDCIYTNSTVKFKFVIHLQDERSLKFFDLKYENVVDWLMCLNSTCAMLSTPNLGYGVGNPPIYKKMSLYSQVPFKGKIVDLLNAWMQRYKEISQILDKNIAYKPNNSREKKTIENSIKACILERTRLLKYINTIRSYELDYLKKFLHPDNLQGLDGLKEHIENLREISRQGGKIF